MKQTIIYLKYFLISFFISTILNPLIIKISKRYRLYDIPNNRKIHSTPISRLGGISIFSSFIISFLLLMTKYKNQLTFNLSVYLIALSLSFILGFIDDLIGIRARYKFIFQIAVASIASSSGLLIKEFTFFKLFSLNFGLFAYPVTIIWILVFMNAVNLIDGMDGLASGIVAIASIFLIIIGIIMKIEIVTFISIIILGSILGFYIFNFPPAKIFMGDGGSYFLGFTYATIGLMGIKKSSLAALFIIPVVILSIPIADIIQVSFSRIKDRKNIFHADMNHLHHKLLNIGLSTKKILIILYTITIILGIISILIVKIPSQFSFTIFILIFLLMFLLFYIINISNKNINNR